MIVGVIQARTSSTRLPGKVLLPLRGRPMLQRQLERVLRSRRLDRVVLATSDEPSDDPLETVAADAGVGLFRGSLEDVLSRVISAARQAPDVTQVVRMTGDCPLACASIIDRVVGEHLEHDADYTSNAVVKSFPNGMDVEVIRFTAFEQAEQESTRKYEREHVTPFLYEHRERFRVHDVRSEQDLSDLRFSVDRPEDYEVVKAAFEQLHDVNPEFEYEEILSWAFDHPQIMSLNSHVDPHEGWKISIARERQSNEGDAS